VYVGSFAFFLDIIFDLCNSHRQTEKLTVVSP
jgi:hypothetical protein